MKDKSYFKFLFLIIPFFKLAGFSEIPAISKIFDAWFILVSALILYKAVFKKYSPSKFVVACGILQLYLFANTMLKGGFSTNLIRNTIGVLLLIVLIDMYVSLNQHIVYKSLIMLFSIYSILNFCIPKHSVFSNYLFGSRTNLTTVATPIVMISVFMLLSDKRLRKKPSMIFFVFVTVATNGILIIKESVSTAIITLVVPIIFYYVLNNFAFLRKIKASVYIIASVVYTFIIVIFQSFDYLKAVFGLLGENMTMTGRLLIWSNAMELFKKAPIFGYGVDMQIVERGGYSTATTYVHNNFLQFCMDGGIVALFLFIFLLLVTVKHTGKLKSKNARLVLAMNVGLIMGMISEAFTSRNFYYVLLLLMAKLLFDEANKKKYLWDTNLL